MIEIKIDNKKIHIDPRLTIKMYQKIQLNPDRYTTPTEILSLYLDLEPDELKGLPVDQIRYVEEIINKHNEEPKTDIVLTFEFGGVNYGMENDWGNMTWGQWTDLEVYSQKDKIQDNIHIIMALLYRPIRVINNKKYELEEYDAKKVMIRAELFKDLPVEYWFGASTFFLLMSTIYIKNMESSMKAMTMLQKMVRRGMRILPKWAQPRRLQDFILSSPFNLRKEI